MVEQERQYNVEDIVALIVKREDCPYCQTQALASYIRNNPDKKDEILTAARKVGLGLPVVKI